jgi:hypothetical protein
VAGAIITPYGGGSINLRNLISGNTPPPTGGGGGGGGGGTPTPEGWPFFPGIYFQVLNSSKTTGEGNPWRWAKSKGTNSSNPYSINSSDNMSIQSRMHRLWPRIRGIMLEFPWGEIETAQGVYDFSYLDAIIDQVRAITPDTNPRYLIMKIPTRSFDNKPGKVLPEDMINPNGTYGGNQLYDYMVLATSGSEGSAIGGTMQMDFTKKTLRDRFAAFHVAVANHLDNELSDGKGKTVTMVTHSESATGANIQPPYGESGNASITSHREARKTMYEQLRLAMPTRLVANDCQSPLDWCRDAFVTTKNNVATEWAKNKRIAMTGSNANWKSGLWRVSATNQGACRYYIDYAAFVLCMAQLQGDCFADRPDEEDWSCTTKFAKWMNEPDGGVVGTKIKACRPPTPAEILNHVRNMNVHMMTIMFFGQSGDYSSFNPNSQTSRDAQTNHNNWGYYQVMGMMDYIHSINGVTGWTAEQAKLNQTPPTHML